MIDSVTSQQGPKVVCIMGPTASGKTSLAIEVAKKLDGEVISVDSALIYKGMDVGTAKPSIEERDGVKHHLIDIINPQESYSVADFLRDSTVAINQLYEKGKVPILAGGTMMYFNALVNGLNELPASDPAVRENIQQQIQNRGLASMHAKLQELDPVSAQRIHPNDSQRITRALEVFYSSGKSMTHWQQQKVAPPPFNFAQFSIMPKERVQLHKYIEERFDLMIAHGFVDEVESLIQKYQLHLDLPSMRSVGYRQVYQYLQGELSQSQMRERAIIATRQLAKRQVTWLRGWPDTYELFSEDPNNVDRLVQKLSAT